MISKKEVEKVLNEFFGHELIYKGIIQVFGSGIYFPNGVSGKKVLEIYKKLGLENKKEQLNEKLEM